jgi:hypothetical protein
MKLEIFKKNKNAFSIKKESIDPNIYWKWVFALAFLVVLGSFVFGFYIFSKVETKDASDSGAQAGTARAIQKEKIYKALEYFEAKHNKSNQILEAPSPVIDPSL